MHTKPKLKISMKGFGQPLHTKDYKNVYQQIDFLVRSVKSGSTREHIPMFMTSLKRKTVLSQVINEIAQRYPEYYLQAMMIEQTPCAIVTPLVKNDKFSSYTWTELSSRTGKWLVMASPPGAWDCRCLTVWKEEDKANEICESIFDRISRMPLFDWQKGRGEYMRLLRSLPMDDDSIIGLIDTKTGKTINFDSQIQERLLPIWNQSLIGDSDAGNQLKAALNQLRHETLD